MSTQEQDKFQHARENAKGWFASIEEMLEGLETGDNEKREEAEQIIHESVLSVLVRDGFVVIGCSMDMGFEVVYNLGRVLFPDGFKVEGRGRNGDMSGHDNDGGYALKHKWL